MATPPLNVALPRFVAPSVKLTIPVTEDGSAAVKVIDWPIVEGFCEEDRVKVGLIFETTWLVVPDAAL